MPHSVDDIRKIVEPVARKHGLERVWLFGSHARGEATPESDIDLRVDGGKVEDYYQLVGLYFDLEEALNSKLDLLTTGSLRDDFLKRIAKEEVLIYANPHP